MEQITDAMSVWLVTAEANSLPIAPPTPQEQLVREPGAVYSFIQADTIAAKTDTRTVRKNVPLPAWTAALTDQRGIN